MHGGGGGSVFIDGRVCRHSALIFISSVAGEAASKGPNGPDTEHLQKTTENTNIPPSPPSIIPFIIFAFILVCEKIT